MPKMFFLICLLFSTVSFAQQSEVFKNISNLQSALGFTTYYNNQNHSQGSVRVAVFDKGFDGYEKEIGASLPTNLVYKPGPVKAPPEAKTDHGLRMAQIFTALATNNMQQPDVIRGLYLYNVFGYSNFKAAIDDAIAHKVDVILYSEVWEFGGNFDGHGFINAQVSRATAAGITWVNAVGNFGVTTYNSSIVTVEDDWVKLPDQNNGLAIRCEKNAANKCPIKAVLSWNDFKDDINPGTDKDLDFALLDDMLNVVQASALRQSADPKESRPNYSKYPREIITAELKPGLYFFKVKNFSKNFTAKDRLRISVDGDDITMPSHSPDESVLNPGDNASVISVGAYDSDRSSISMRLNKPDIMAPSSVILEDGSEFRGSSNANAMVAAGVALLKAQGNASMTRSQILNAISIPFDWNLGALSLNVLRFGPAQGMNCFRSQEWPQAPDYIKTALLSGAVLVETTAQYRLMVPFDPVQLAPDLQRSRFDDMILITADGNYIVYPRGMGAPQGSVEIFQRPLETGLCQDPAKKSGRMFRL